MKISFLPGMLCDQRLWQPVIDQLRNNHDCNFINLLPCDSLSQMIDKAISESSNSDLLVAFSLGGYIAQEVAVSHPTHIKRLILLGTAGTGLSEKEIELRQQVLKIAKKQNFDPMPSSRSRDFVGSDADESVRLLVQQMARDAGAERFISQLSSTLNRKQTLDKLVEYRGATAVVAAQDDKIVPIAESKKLALAIPNSRFVCLKQCGHMIPLEQPMVVTQLINHFIERHYAA